MRTLILTVSLAATFAFGMLQMAQAASCRTDCDRQGSCVTHCDDWHHA